MTATIKIKHLCATRVFALIALLTLNTAVLAQGADGKASYQPCVSCHGASGEGNQALNAPALAGQSASYLSRQLRHFKLGTRGNNADDSIGQQMRAMVVTLADDAAIDAVANYLEQLTPPVAGEPDTSKSNMRNGANQYNGYCGACHGAKAEGNSALNAPRLAGLDIAYLQRQMLHFQNGRRGSAKDDRLGKQMAMMASTLPDKDLADVLGFIAAAGASN